LAGAEISKKSLDDTHATTPLTSVLCIVSLPLTNSLNKFPRQRTSRGKAYQQYYI
jgi:hypothetical protein